MNLPKLVEKSSYRSVDVAASDMKCSSDWVSRRPKSCDGLIRKGEWFVDDPSIASLVQFSFLWCQRCATDPRSPCGVLVDAARPTR